jgi:hypothetical protein
MRVRMRRSRLICNEIVCMTRGSLTIPTCIHNLYTQNGRHADNLAGGRINVKMNKNYDIALCRHTIFIVEQTCANVHKHTYTHGVILLIYKLISCSYYTMTYMCQLG